MAEGVIEEIQWTDKAKRTFNHIVDYRRKEWTEKLSVVSALNKHNQLSLSEKLEESG